MIKIIIPGIPVPKGRARSRIVKTKQGGMFITHYTPKETQVYEDSVRWLSKSAMIDKQPLDCPLEAIINVFLPIPESWSKRKREWALNDELRPDTKPDLDNVIKAIFDGMDKIVFVNDSRICKMTCEKFYSDNPGVEIEIKPLTTKESADG